MDGHFACPQFVYSIIIILYTYMKLPPQLLSPSPFHLIIINQTIITGHDWTPYIRHVVSNLEGNSNPGAVDQRTTELRNKIEEIVLCDVKSEDMLSPYQKPFNIVHTNLCLEIVCETAADFIDALSNLRKLVRPGGYLLCLTAKEGSWYTCAGFGTKLHQLFLNESEILKAFTDAGKCEVECVHVVHTCTYLQLSYII